jgi:aryl-alcohol dehydrogenase-like predicted oxidoreductase
MHYNALGTSDILVSAVSFGCMSLNGTHEDNAEILHRALDHGINYFDTADVYDKGENELTVGKAFKSVRSKVIIATKVGNQWKKDGSGFDWNPSKAHILQSVHESLRRLQTDYIDLYQLHGGTINDPIDETIEAFETLKTAGKIRHYGISSIRPNVIREYVKRSSIVSVMMQYSLLDRRPEESCLDLLKDHKISVLARGALAKGLLVDKPAGTFLNYTETDVQEAKKTVDKLRNANRSNAETAIQFVLHHPSVASAVIGIRTMEQLDTILAFQNAKLNDQEIKQLQSSIPPTYYDQHR